MKSLESFYNQDRERSSLDDDQFAVLHQLSKSLAYLLLLQPIHNLLLSCLAYVLHSIEFQGKVEGPALQYSKSKVEEQSSKLFGVLTADPTKALVSFAAR